MLLSKESFVKIRSYTILMSEKKGWTLLTFINLSDHTLLFQKVESSWCQIDKNLLIKC